MFVKTYMTPNPITISPDANHPQAVSLLRKHKIRNLPVVEDGRLIGVVVEKDLLSTQPSPATTLNVYEIYSLLEKLLVQQIMSHPAITVEGDCPIEEAARIMLEKKISCLPVMEGEQLVGIITETDVFNVLVDVMGGRETGMRITLILPDRPGELAKIARFVADSGGNILAVTSSQIVEKGGNEVMVKESNANSDQLIKLIKESGVEILDTRASTKYQPRLFE